VFFTEWEEIVQSLDRVLIVEDDPEWQEEVSSMLSEAGYDYELAADYETGLDALCKTRLLALILDLKLRTDPPENEDFVGWQLAQEALDRDVPIIIVTGHPSVTRARRAFRDYKVIDFLDKEHLTRQELIERVSEGIEASRRKQLSSGETQKAIEKIREIFYGGKRVSVKERG
jgi:DNA-binding NtrC family response regulator